MSKPYYQVMDEQEYNRILRRLDMLHRQGVKAHAKHLCREPWMKEYVRMDRWTELDQVMELKSEPFDAEYDAEHFRDCFNDNFLCEAYYKEENGKYYVYSGWIMRVGFVSYAYNFGQNGQYFMFSNGS